MLFLAAAAALAAAWLLLRHRRRLPRFWRRLAQRADWPLPVHLISLARLPAKRTSALQRAAEAGLTDVSVFVLEIGADPSASSRIAASVVGLGPNGQTESAYGSACHRREGTPSEAAIDS